MKLCYWVPLFLAGTAGMLFGEVKPASIFGSHMVLQRQMPIPVWGTAAPGETVTLTLGEQKRSVIAEKDGRWIIRLVPMEAGEHYEMVLSGSATKTPTKFTDVAIGEVWICSGQSNMEFSTQQSVNGLQEVEAATNPQIRVFHVAHNTPAAPVSTVTGAWAVASPESIRSFSAVGYFFGREIQKYIQVPVGLIQTAWGGTPAETWTRLEALRDDPDYAEILKRRDMTPGTASAEMRPKVEEEVKKVQVMQAAWDGQINQLLAAPGNPPAAWFNPPIELKDWKPIETPGQWETQANLKMDGVVWLRKVVDVPAAMAAEAVTLSLGTVDDFDFTWVNGKLVGHIGKETKSFWLTARHYPLPAGLLKPGANVILVRCIDHGGGGGFTGQASDMKLIPATGAPLPLAGTWQYRIEKNMGIRPSNPGALQNIAGVLYDGMIAPLIPYGIRGAIWYQGESNASRAEQYAKLFPTMIRNWRQDWGQGDFPFYFVQLANFKAVEAEPCESDWAELREAQFKTLALFHTGMAVAIDIGEAGDIHPKDKQDVGIRLALWALAQDYGIKIPDGFFGTVPGLKSFFQKPIVHSGPLYSSYKVEGSTIRVSFNHIGGGLLAKGDAGLTGFAIAGSNKKFVWAQARIVGNDIIVSSPEVPHPVAVRYDWANNPEGNLYNREGLPAGPFRTDVWSGITAGKR